MTVLIYCKCHKINLTCGESYIDSPYWIKDKNATINPINIHNNNYFQYTVALALNQKLNLKNSKIILKIKPYKLKC